MSEKLEEKMSGALLAFVDFLYAVVFGLIVAETFHKVVFSEKKSYLDKTSALLLVVGVFYFLMWDWLHGRLLTLKNPYKSYRRFFVELIIAFCGYGAAYAVVHAKASFLIYIALILFLGARWAKDTLKEYPESKDRFELYIIQSHQIVHATLGLFAFGIWYLFVRTEITLVEAGYFILFGWIFVFQYELFIPRLKGIIAGPCVPFVNKKRMDKIRSFMLKLLRYLRKR